MKVKGQDLITFFQEWPMGEDVYHEEAPFSQREDGVLCEESEDGKLGLPVNPQETYDVKWGILGWQGEGPEPSNFDDDLVRVLRKWLKARTTATLLLEVPKAEQDAAIELLKSKGWKVKA